ncbi:MAG: dTDP-4-dehydrorhamnose 3,5-epimerase [Terricaulis sp.]
MDFQNTALPGCFLVHAGASGDARGFFSRLYCADAFAEKAPGFTVTQSSVSASAERGTLRGLHYQTAPFMEAKLVRCLRGAVFDVMVDLRRGSPTFGQWTSAELTESNHAALYAPAGFAHGFQTLAADTLIWYAITPAYQAERAAGIRWDDPDLAIEWPLPPTQVSPRDTQLPRLAALDMNTLDDFA